MNIFLTAAASLAITCASAAGAWAERPVNAVQPPAQPAAGQAVATIAAAGSATVARAPDQAVVSVGASTVAPTSVAAQDQLNQALDKIVRAVKGVNLPGMVVQTQWVSLQPVYSRQRFENDEEPREPKITGYRASNTVSVTIADVARAGAVIDAAIAAGANQLGGISFELKDDKEAKSEALRAAARDARAKADTIAEALGLRVLRVVEVTAGGAAPPRPMGGMARMTLSADMMEGAPTTIEPGQVSVHETVTVIVEVQ